jgi:hypothetical protein
MRAFIVSMKWYYYMKTKATARVLCVLVKIIICSANYIREINFITW